LAGRQQPRAASSASQRHRTDLSVTGALDIVRAYATVLRRAPHATTGVPSSLLPYPVDTIKEAIAVVLRRMPPSDGMSLWALEEAYARLASFIPDDDAASARGREADPSGDPDRSRSAHSHTTSRIKTTIRERERRFLAEFQKLCAAPQRT